MSIIIFQKILLSSFNVYKFYFSKYVDTSCWKEYCVYLIVYAIQYEILWEEWIVLTLFLIQYTDSGHEIGSIIINNRHCDQEKRLRAREREREREREGGSLQIVLSVTEFLKFLSYTQTHIQYNTSMHAINYHYYYYYY